MTAEVVAGVATAAMAYTIAAAAAGTNNDVAICSGVWPKNTDGASVT